MKKLRFSIRIKLIIWYTVIFITLLLIFLLAMNMMLNQTMISHTDSEIQKHLEAIKYFLSNKTFTYDEVKEDLEEEDAELVGPAKVLSGARHLANRTRICPPTNL